MTRFTRLFVLPLFLRLRVKIWNWNSFYNRISNFVQSPILSADRNLGSGFPTFRPAPDSPPLQIHPPSRINLAPDLSLFQILPRSRFPGRTGSTTSQICVPSKSTPRPDSPPPQEMRPLSRPAGYKQLTMFLGFLSWVAKTQHNHQTKSEWCAPINHVGQPKKPGSGTSLFHRKMFSQA